MEIQLKTLTETLELNRKAFSEQNEEKKRRISMLHAEMKELQDRVNEQNAKNAYIDSKNQELNQDLNKVVEENEGVIQRLKKDNEKLRLENKDLDNRTTNLRNEVDGFKVHLEERGKEFD